MNIEQLFLNYKGCRLYTTVMKPDNIKKPEGYIIIHPFAEEKKSAHRILFEVANSIAEQGYYVLMFDFSGCGDSTGSLLTTTLDDWLEELEFISGFFKENYLLNKVHYLGLRLGSFIANVYWNNLKFRDKLILLEPVINPEEYFRKILKSKLFKELLTQGNVSSNRNKLIEDLKADKSLDFDGHEIGAAFYKSIVKHKDDFNFSNTKDISIINISQTGKVSKEYLRLIDNTLLKKENLNTIKMEPFWDRIESPPKVHELKELIDNCL